MCIKTWAIAGLIGVFGLAASAAQDVADLLHRQTQELMDAVGAGSTAVTTHLDDEYETYHGHELHCQYRTTDTWVKTNAGWRIVAGQVLALRTDPSAVPLTPLQMEEYTGRYALTPGIIYEIRNNGGVLQGQRTGGRPETLQAEVPDMLFAGGKPRYRKVFLRGPNGRINGFAERRDLDAAAVVALKACANMY